MINALFILICSLWVATGWTGYRLGVLRGQKFLIAEIENVQLAYRNDLKKIREDYVGRVNQISAEIENQLSFKANQAKTIYTDAFSKGHTEGQADMAKTIRERLEQKRVEKSAQTEATSQE